MVRDNLNTGTRGTGVLSAYLQIKTYHFDDSHNPCQHRLNVFSISPSGLSSRWVLYMKETIRNFNPETTTMIDIIDYLGKSPDCKVQLQDEEQTLTYERVNDERGYMKAVRVIETGEIIEV